MTSQRVHVDQARTCLRARSGPPSLQEARPTSISQIGKTEARIRADIFLRACSHLEVKKYGINASGRGSTLWKPKDGPTSQDRDPGQESGPALGLLGCLVLPARPGRTPSA